MSQTLVYFSEVKVGGNVDCFNGIIDNPGRIGWAMEGISVDGNIFLNGGFKIAGELRLTNAKVGKDVDCRSANLINPGGITLQLRVADSAGVSSSEMPSGATAK